ncbi:hypothetical protein [Sphingomonas psychrotolerans]|uniref:hypothetical protein n=1 Tax=Sphingomonas psychrotolerans TaxID=1327635 RepID=UPI001F3F4900|nr:hypothetical protein [Sphingomonas psychrotolerans]
MKSGQIAHLDHDNSNNVETNLAFLCLDHHDQYDSVTSQSKKITIAEVKAFKLELSTSLASAFAQRVHFGEIQTPPRDPYAGQYLRLGAGTDSADLSLIPLPDSVEGYPRYFVTGMAIRTVAGGPNMGFLDFEGIMYDTGVIIFERKSSGFTEAKLARTCLELDGKGKLIVDEDNTLGLYGFNVSFIGQYAKAGSDR